jgi:hypothetical protein
MLVAHAPSLYHSDLKLAHTALLSTCAQVDLLVRDFGMLVPRQPSLKPLDPARMQRLMGNGTGASQGATAAGNITPPPASSAPMQSGNAAGGEQAGVAPGADGHRRMQQQQAGAATVTPNDPLFPGQWALQRVMAQGAWRAAGTGAPDLIIAVGVHAVDGVEAARFGANTCLHLEWMAVMESGDPP